MELKTNIFTITEANNTIYDLSEKYVAKTVIAFKIVGSNEVLITAGELGENFIRLDPTEVSLGDTIKVVFKTETAASQEESLHIRLAKLEQTISKLEENNKILEEALKNRVNITAFQAWISLLEKKLGINLVDVTGSVTSTLTRLRD